MYNDETAKQTCRDNVHSCALAYQLPSAALRTQVRDLKEALASFEHDLYTLT
jgi:hypothetical protein